MGHRSSEKEVNNEGALSFSMPLIAGPYIEVTVIAITERIGRKILDNWGNDMVAQLNQLILQVSKTIPFRSNLERHLIRAAMVFTFFAFSRSGTITPSRCWSR
jgi:hypothetical protein